MRKIARTAALALALAAVCLQAAIAPASAEAPAGAPSKKLGAIVIDDFGNNMAGTEEMLSLPIHLTVAVMPFLPTTKRDAEWAHRLGHDVLVHLPMEPKHGRKEWLGPGAITTDLSEAEIRKRVNAAIDEVPYAVGINNHMGSKATGDKRVMHIVLTVCKERGLFFLDSRTNYRSVVPQVSAEVGVKTVTNHLFLDDMSSHKHISGQLDKFRKMVDEQDVCVAIGHVGRPGKYTAAVLRKSIPALAKDITFVSLSELIAIKDNSLRPGL